MAPHMSAPAVLSASEVRTLYNRLLIPLVHTPPLLTFQVSVIIPAKDEALTIGATLGALTNQVDLTGKPFDHARYEIIVLANNCRDDTAAIARRFGLRHPGLQLHVVEMNLPPAVACVGKARQLLMDEAYRRLSVLPNHQEIIASTDADTRVAPTWLAANLYEIGRGADAVGGRIITDSNSRAALGPQARYYYLCDVGYRLLIAELESLLYPCEHDPWPRHYQHFGGSLAVTVETYEQVGGLPSVRSLEDIMFAYGLARFARKLRHSPLVRVVTSARRNGRVQCGLSAQLCEWTEMGREGRAFLVDPLSKIETRLHCRPRLRALQLRVRAGEILPKADIADLAAALSLPPAFVAAELYTAQPFDVLRGNLENRQEITPAWQTRWPRVEFAEAIADLRLRVEELRRDATAETRAVAPILNPFEEVEAIALGTLPANVTQIAAYTHQKHVVNNVAG